MLDSKQYFKITKEYLKKTMDSQQKIIVEAAKMMGDCMCENGIVQLFGMGHGRAFSMELGYRAGGLMPFHQFNTKDLALRGIISEAELYSDDFENKLEMVNHLWNTYKIEATDMFILISLDGNEGILVEAALKAKKEGHKVIAVLNKAHCDAAVSGHPSKQKLDTVADLIIDLQVNNPDVVLESAGGVPLCQVSTIVGNVIAQMLTAEAYKYFKDNNKECPVLLSANLKGADVHNREISDRYLGRWNA